MNVMRDVSSGRVLVSVFSSPITNPGAGKTAAAPELVPSCFSLKEKRLRHF